MIVRFAGFPWVSFSGLVVSFSGGGWGLTVFVYEITIGRGQRSAGCSITSVSNRYDPEPDERAARLLSTVARGCVLLALLDGVVGRVFASPVQTCVMAGVVMGATVQWAVIYSRLRGRRDLQPAYGPPWPAMLFVGLVCGLVAGGVDALIVVR